MACCSLLTAALSWAFSGDCFALVHMHALAVQQQQQLLLNPHSALRACLALVVSNSHSQHPSCLAPTIIHTQHPGLVAKLKLTQQASHHHVQEQHEGGAGHGGDGPGGQGDRGLHLDWYVRGWSVGRGEMRGRTWVKWRGRSYPCMTRTRRCT